jgi:hypothetical protein
LSGTLPIALGARPRGRLLLPTPAAHRPRHDSPSALREPRQAPLRRRCGSRRTSCPAYREHHRRRLARAVRSSGARAEHERRARRWSIVSLPLLVLTRQSVRKIISQSNSVRGARATARRGSMGGLHFGSAAGLDLVRNNRVVGCSRQNLNLLPLLHNKRTLGPPEPWWSPGAAPSVRGYLQHPSR